MFHVKHSSTPRRITWRIEGGTLSRLTGERLPYGLRVFVDEGSGLMEWSCVHFSTAKSRATLIRRVRRLYPDARP